MKIDVLCDCKEDDSQYMELEKVEHVKGEVAVLHYRCSYCDKSVHLVIDK